MSTILRIVTVSVGRAIGALLVGLVAVWLIAMSVSHHHSHVDCEDHRLSIGSSLCAGKQLSVLGRRSHPSRAAATAPGAGGRALTSHRLHLMNGRIAAPGADRQRVEGRQPTSGHKLSKSESTRPTPSLTRPAS
jgi:hypothetical protein